MLVFSWFDLMCLNIKFGNEKVNSIFEEKSQVDRFSKMFFCTLVVSFRLPFFFSFSIQDNHMKSHCWKAVQEALVIELEELKS